MHIERLRQIRPVIQISKPKQPGHLKTNAKREMLNLGKFRSLLPSLTKLVVRLVSQFQ